MLRPQHQRTVDRLRDLFADDPNFPALLVGGSIAKGWERDDSDVDIILLATDEEYARRAPARAFHYFTQELSDYPGGYVDGKIMDWAFLQEVAERGNEATRSAFVGVSIVCSRVPELASLLARITAYPEAERAAKIQSFYAQVLAMQWYIGEAEKRGDRYLLMHSTAELVLYSGRLLLAHNRIFYPYRKWLLRTLQSAPHQPDNFLALIDQLLAVPSKANADAVCDSLLNFTAWEAPPEGWPMRFMEDTEWTWRTGCAPVADR